jgi:hypothetical protein
VAFEGAEGFHGGLALGQAAPVIGAAGCVVTQLDDGHAGTIKLPPPRPILWPLRPAESAEHQITNDGSQLIITITHAPLRGVTAEMLQWWFRHVAGTMSYAGGIWPRYLVWHPLDHVSYDVVSPAADGGVGPAPSCTSSKR